MALKLPKRFQEDDRRYLEHMDGLLDVRMEGDRKRYRHSVGVCLTAIDLAHAYGVDEFHAAAAGLIHDWDKVVKTEELVARALHYGIRIEGDITRSTALLHGPVAAVELPHLFPELPPEVFQAVDRHTSAAIGMTPLDMVVFVADAIEPNRHGDYAKELRRMVGEVSLDELFFSCFSQGIAYVIESGRYLYPTAIDIYNHYANLMR